MWTIRRACRENDDEFDAVQVLFTGDGFVDKEVVRVATDVPMLCEEAVQHALVSIREQAKWDRFDG